MIAWWGKKEAEVGEGEERGKEKEAGYESYVVGCRREKD